jgi:hypothetical protein
MRDMTDEERQALYARWTLIAKLDEVIDAHIRAPGSGYGVDMIAADLGHIFGEMIRRAPDGDRAERVARQFMSVAEQASQGRLHMNCLIKLDDQVGQTEGTA